MAAPILSDYWLTLILQIFPECNHFGYHRFAQLKSFPKSSALLSTRQGMMKNERIYKILNLCIAAVWFVNGLFCKVLHLVPRHEQIVARILGNSFARPLTILIGLSEVVMAVWVISRFQSKLNAILQIIIVATMNTLEFILVPDLLLWGRLNVVFAGCFILLVFYNEFVLHKNLTRQKAYV